MIADPEISRLIEEFESDDSVNVEFRHHEETEANQANFLENVKQIFTEILWFNTKSVDSAQADLGRHCLSSSRSRMLSINEPSTA